MADFCEFIIDCEHKTAPVQSTGYPSIRTTNIGRGWLELDDVNRVSQATYEEWTRRSKPKEGDLILAREAPIGNVAIIPKNLEVCLGQRTVLIRPNREKVNPRFLLYLLLGNEIQSKFQAFSGGATVAHLNMGEIRKLELPKIPDRIIQEKTAAMLSAYDDLIENNLRRIKILEEMAQTIYREWFVKFRFPGHQKVKMVNSPLGKIPEGWEVEELRNIFDIKYGKTLPKTKISDKGLYPVYGAGDVIGYYDKVICQEKCALVTSRGNGSGTVWRTREAAFVTNNSLIILPKIDFKHWDYSFIELFLKHSNVMEAKTGSAQPQVTIENLNYVKGIVPGQKILEGFTAFSIPIYEHVDLIFKKNRILRQTRDLLLPKLISGELDVSELDIKTGRNDPSPLVGEGWDGGNG